jgi:hypothetical protein
MTTNVILARLSFVRWLGDDLVHVLRSGFTLCVLRPPRSAVVMTGSIPGEQLCPSCGRKARSLKLLVEE